MRILSLLKRALLVSLATAGLAVASAQAQAIDRIGVPGPLAFDGKAYALAWTSNPSSGYFKQEYLPAGQDTATYTEMLMIDVLETGVTVEAALASQVKFLKQRERKDSAFNMAVLQNKETGQILLDFIISDDVNGRSIVEWNAYRYTPHTGKDGKKGVMLFALSRRAYDDDIAGFLKSLRPLRVTYINVVAHHTLPAITTSGQ
jgi:hypothetical protein